jgi:hypothetical protein
MNHFLMFGRSIAVAFTTKHRSIAMKTLTPLEQLQEKLWLKALPENIDIPTGPARDLIVTKPVAHATVDDLAFAADALLRQSIALHRKADAMKQIHDLARRAGAVGAANAVTSAVRMLEAAE